MTPRSDSEQGYYDGASERAASEFAIGKLKDLKERLGL